MRMTGNTILITGGTSGIGRALAERFHDRGNRVVVAGRRQALLDEIVDAHPGMVGRALDVSDAGAIEAFAARVRDEFPDLNVLVNNAGVSRPERLTEGGDIALARAMIDTNVLGVLQLTMALVPHLRRRDDAAVIATSSGLAFVPLGALPTYCATKAFLHSWWQSLRAQLAGSGVEVLELIPPYVQTELGGPDQAVDPAAMPLAAYVDEVMANLAAGETPGGEILVQRVGMLRHAERNGAYAQVYATMNPAPEPPAAG